NNPAGTTKAVSDSKAGSGVKLSRSYGKSAADSLWVRSFGSSTLKQARARSVSGGEKPDVGNAAGPAAGSATVTGRNCWWQSPMSHGPALIPATTSSVPTIARNPVRLTSDKYKPTPAKKT